jgi:hypothetical protein
VRFSELLFIFDRIWRDLSYSLHLLTGVGYFSSVVIDHGRRSPAKRRMPAFVIVKLDPFSDASLRF